MLLWILAFVGGLLTTLSPCNLPVLPFVLARVGQPFAGSGVPLLVWLNSPPLSRDQLWGRVVLVTVWTISCINCVRTRPHVREVTPDWG